MRLPAATPGVTQTRDSVGTVRQRGRFERVGFSRHDCCRGTPNQVTFDSFKWSSATCTKGPSRAKEVFSQSLCWWGMFVRSLVASVAILPGIVFGPVASAQRAGETMLWPNAWIIGKAVDAEGRVGIFLLDGTNGQLLACRPGKVPCAIVKNSEFSKDSGVATVVQPEGSAKVSNIYLFDLKLKTVRSCDAQECSEQQALKSIQ